MWRQQYLLKVSDINKYMLGETNHQALLTYPHRRKEVEVLPACSLLLASSV